MKVTLSFEKLTSSFAFIGILLSGGLSPEARAAWCASYNQMEIFYPAPTMWDAQTYASGTCIDMWGSTRKLMVENLYKAIVVTPVAPIADLLPATAWGVTGGGTAPDPASTVLHLKSTYFPDRIHEGYQSTAPPAGAFNYIPWRTTNFAGLGSPASGNYYGWFSQNPAGVGEGLTWDYVPFDKVKWIERLEFGVEMTTSGVNGTPPAGSPYVAPCGNCLVVTGAVVLNVSNTTPELGLMHFLTDTSIGNWAASGSCGPGNGQPHGFHYQMDFAGNYLRRRTDNFCSGLGLLGPCPASGTINSGAWECNDGPYNDANSPTRSTVQGFGARLKFDPGWQAGYWNGRALYMRIFYRD